VQQDHFDMLLVNLRMDSTAVKEMNIKWVSETGIVESIAAVVKDFKETRGLLVSLYHHHSGFILSGSCCFRFTESADIVWLVVSVWIKPPKALMIESSQQTAGVQLLQSAQQLV